MLKFSWALGTHWQPVQFSEQVESVKDLSRVFPDGPVAKTALPCRGRRLDLWPGN